MEILIHYVLTGARDSAFLMSFRLLWAADTDFLLLSGRELNFGLPYLEKFRW